MSSLLVRASTGIDRFFGNISERLEATTVVLTVTVGVCVALRSANLPSEAAWGGGKPWLIGSVAAAVALALAQVLVYFRRRKARGDAALDDACRVVASHLDDAIPDLPLKQVGIHIWRVAGLPKARYLRRAAHFLLAGERAHSGITWKEGKGVVGMAWKERHPKAINLETLYAKHNTPTRWNSLSEDERLGLTWAERKGLPRYKTVYAAPLYRRAPGVENPPVRGILAVDILVTGKTKKLELATLKDKEFDVVVGLCETAIAPKGAES